MKLFLALFFMFLKMAHRANRVLKLHIEKERPKVDPRLPLEFISWRRRKLPGTPFKIVLEEAMKHQQMDGNRGKPERYGERGTYALRL